jgi:hypothetical protein
MCSTRFVYMWRRGRASSVLNVILEYLQAALVRYRTEYVKSQDVNLLNLSKRESIYTYDVSGPYHPFRFVHISYILVADPIVIVSI